MDHEWVDVFPMKNGGYFSNRHVSLLEGSSSGCWPSICQSGSPSWKTKNFTSSLWPTGKMIHDIPPRIKFFVWNLWGCGRNSWMMCFFFFFKFHPITCFFLCGMIPQPKVTHHPIRHRKTWKTWNNWFLQQFSHWFQVEIALVIASVVDSKFVLEVVETGRLAGRWDGLGW